MIISYISNAHFDLSKLEPSTIPDFAQTCIFSRVLSPLHDGGQLLGVQLRLEVVGHDARVEAQSSRVSFDAAEQSSRS